MNVPFDPLADPLFRNAKLAHGAELPVLGRRVVFESNSSAVLEALIPLAGRLQYQTRYLG